MSASVSATTTASTSTTTEDDPVFHYRTIDEFYEQAHAIPNTITTTNDADNKPSSSAEPNSCCSWLGHQLYTLFWRRRAYLLIIFAVAFGSLADELEYGSMAVVVSDARFRHEMLTSGQTGQQEHHEHHAAQVFAAVSVGSLLGRVVSGSIMDHPSPTFGGRRKIYMAGLSLGLLTSIGAATCPTSGGIGWFLFLTYQVLSGLGSALAYAGGSVLLIELFPASCRGTYGSIASFFWSMGGVYSSIMAVYLIQRLDTDEDEDGLSFQQSEPGASTMSGWRLYLLAVAMPSLIGLILAIFIVPESPRHLALSGRFEEAASVANYVGLRMKGGDDSSIETTTTTEEQPTSFALLQVQEIQHHYETRSSSRQQQSLSCGSLVKGYLDLLFQRDHGSHLKWILWTLIVWRTLLIFPGHLHGSWQQTILLLVENEWMRSHAYALTSVFSAFSFATKLASLFFMDSFSRPALFTFTIFVGVICMVVFAIAVAKEGLEPYSNDGVVDTTKHNNNTDDTTRDDLVVDDGESSSGSFLICSVMVLSLCFVTISNTVLNTLVGLWTSELLPTNVRGTGLSIIGLFAGSAWILTNYVGGALMEQNHNGAVMLLLLTALGNGLAGIVPAVATGSVLRNTQGEDLAEDSTDVSTRGRQAIPDSDCINDDDDVNETRELEIPRID